MFGVRDYETNMHVCWRVMVGFTELVEGSKTRPLIIRSLFEKTQHRRINICLKSIATASQESNCSHLIALGSGVLDLRTRHMRMRMLFTSCFFITKQLLTNIIHCHYTNTVIH